MATRKDLLEAHAHHRRRLIAALVSGAPGGREVEPPRPGRTIVAGLVIAVLVLAGTAVRGLLDPPSRVDWTAEGLVSDRDTGLDHLVLRTADPADAPDATEVRPLANRTSAMLLLGADVASRDVDADDLADRRRGAPVGVVGAPASPPPASGLVPTGWTACVSDPSEPSGAPGVTVHVARQPTATPVPGRAFVVRSSSGAVHLMAQAGEAGGDGRAHAYRVPRGRGSSPDTLLDAVAGTRLAAAVPVPDAWLDLVPTGARLGRAAFGVRLGDLDRPWPLRDRLGDPDARVGAEVGDLLEVDGRAYLATSGGVRPLTGFERAVWRGLAPPVDDPLGTFVLAALPDVAFDVAPAASGWPSAVPDRGAAGGPPCAVLDTTGGEPGVLLATTDAGGPTGPGDVVRRVEPGRGALVRAAGDDDAPVVLIDDAGARHVLGAGPEQANLGYAGVTPVVVPPAWLALFAPGVELTVEAARCPPGSDPACSGE